MSPIMGLRRIASRDRLKTMTHNDGPVSPASIAGPDFFHMERIKRVSSSSSISSLGMLLNFHYCAIWEIKC